MHKSLDNALALASSIRYRGDKASTGQIDNQSTIIKIRDSFYKDGLRISAKTTPVIGEKLIKVCSNLNIPFELIEAFVYASPDIQAECYSGSGSNCVIRFSSTLIDLLDEEEFMFVAGHELGHYLLNHTPLQSVGGSNLDQFLQIRAQEISADRMGLIACGSIDVAVRALIKTVSGLSSKHLRFDVGEFLSQLGRVSDSKPTGNLDRTHPPMIIRCRALLWFSMSNSYSTQLYENNNSELEKLDERVRIDLNKDVDGVIREKIKACKDNFKLWTAAKLIVESGSFSKEKQKIVELEFGSKLMASLKAFLSDLSTQNALNVISERVNDASQELELMIPDAHSQEKQRLINEVLSLFNN